MKANIGLIGLAVMGENLVLNLESKGYRVAVYNRTISKVDDFHSNRGKDKNIIFTHSLEELVNSVERPRKIMMMVKAGSAVDSNIDLLLPLLEKGDIIIDGGNSNYLDSERRMQRVESENKYFIGCGISGGEEGALNGPSLMIGGSKAAYQEIRPIFEAISAKVDNNTPCCAWIGTGGAGHFVKMVHNGIEYADMQLIAETYNIMKKVYHLSTEEMAELFSTWNEGELNSYLIEITSHILKYKTEDNSYLLDNILDVAGQKGTGKLSAITALEVNVPLTLVSSSVFERYLSAEKGEREEASKLYKKPASTNVNKTQDFANKLKAALYCGKIISYTQGFELMKRMSDEKGWELKLGEIALIWRGGCIIRSAFLNKIDDAYKDNSKLSNLVFDPFFKEVLTEGEQALREIVALSITSRISCPTLSSAINWFDSFTDNDMPTSLIQAQRDYFGSHTYERKDTERGQFFHTNWTGKGGNTTSNSYNG